MTKHVKLTRLELDVMKLLWDAEEASVRELLDKLPEEERPAYTTVQTIVQRLETKGAVKRTRKIGNAFMYVPLISRASAYRRVIDDLLGLFGGDAQPLVAALVEERKISLGDLRELEKLARSGEEKKR